jgi:signal transduction histidine kinase
MYDPSIRRVRILQEILTHDETRFRNVNSPEVAGRVSGSKLSTGSRVSRGHQMVLFAAAALAALIVLWAVANLTVDGFAFAQAGHAKLRGGEEAASAVARIFAALVLFMFSAEGAGWRMRWVAGGLVVLGLGHLIFGYVEPTVQIDPIETNEALYEGFVTQTLACALFAVGLCTIRPPGRLLRAAMAVPVAMVAAYVLIFEFLHGDNWMPRLSIEAVEDPGDTVNFALPFGWLTHWHWALAALPLGLALAAAAGAFIQNRRGLLRSWLLFAIVLLAGAQLHEYFWPSPYGGDLLTTADILSLVFAVVVAVGGITELRRVALERAALLASERERVRRLSELTALKADFSAMVAHELDGPIGALRKLAELVSVEGDDREIRNYATSTMEVEIDALNRLVADVRSAARVERDDFRIEPLSLPIGALIDDAEAYARTLPGEHSVRVTYVGTLAPRERVWADPERIGQVLRNLLSNAAKYTPANAPIEIRASRSPHNGHIQIEVADHGPGISPEDLRRIFEKFGRGRDEQGKKVSGAGLGLYLSRRIVQSHGSDLRVQSSPGEGSVFSFDLEVTR